MLHWGDKIGIAVHYNHEWSTMGGSGSAGSASPSFVSVKDHWSIRYHLHELSSDHFWRSTLSTADDGQLTDGGYHAKKAVCNIKHCSLHHVLGRSGVIVQDIRVRFVQSEKISFQTNIVQVLVENKGHFFYRIRLDNEPCEFFEKRAVKPCDEVEVGRFVEPKSTVLGNYGKIGARGFNEVHCRNVGDGFTLRIKEKMKCHAPTTKVGNGKQGGNDRPTRFVVNEDFPLILGRRAPREHVVRADVYGRSFGSG
mmetsp:Transcript_7005/g.16757  ORF Transcript_7005/g.16757 Transcript_7005/m.16757 type:complete len:253 (+) Transcript_7005:1434-2192(+)